MIDVYYWPDPERVEDHHHARGVEFALPGHLGDIGRGDQFKPEFLAISPNNRMPAIVDHEPAQGSEPIAIFESGTILMYLAEKTGRFLPADTRGRYEVMQWVMWQMGNLGPMLGQAHHFRQYASDQVPYAIDRYTNETNRLYGVMNTRLADRELLAGDYSIADMASWPWIVPYKRQGQSLEDFPHLKRWFETIQARPAVQRGFAVGEEWRDRPMDDEAKKVLFGQRATV